MAGNYGETEEENMELYLMRNNNLFEQTILAELEHEQRNEYNPLAWYELPEEMYQNQTFENDYDKAGPDVRYPFPGYDPDPTNDYEDAKPFPLDYEDESQSQYFAEHSPWEREDYIPLKTSQFPFAPISDSNITAEHAANMFLAPDVDQIYASEWDFTDRLLNMNFSLLDIATFVHNNPQYSRYFRVTSFDPLKAAQMEYQRSAELVEWGRQRNNIDTGIQQARNADSIPTPFSSNVVKANNNNNDTVEFQDIDDIDDEYSNALIPEPKFLEVEVVFDSMGQMVRSQPLPETDDKYAHAYLIQDPHVFRKRFEEGIEEIEAKFEQKRAESAKNQNADFDPEEETEIADLGNPDFEHDLSDMDGSITGTPLENQIEDQEILSEAFKPPTTLLEYRLWQQRVPDLLKEKEDEFVFRIETNQIYRQYLRFRDMLKNYQKEREARRVQLPLLDEKSRSAAIQLDKALLPKMIKAKKIFLQYRKELLSKMEQVDVQGWMQEENEFSELPEETRQHGKHIQTLQDSIANLLQGQFEQYQKDIIKSGFGDLLSGLEETERFLPSTMKRVYEFNKLKQQLQHSRQTLLQQIKDLSKKHNVDMNDTLLKFEMYQPNEEHPLYDDRLLNITGFGAAEVEFMQPKNDWKEKFEQLNSIIANKNIDTSHPSLQQYIKQAEKLQRQHDPDAPIVTADFLKKEVEAAQKRFSELEKTVTSPDTKLEDIPKLREIKDKFEKMRAELTNTLQSTAQQHTHPFTNNEDEFEKETRKTITKHQMNNNTTSDTQQSRQ